MNTIWTEAREEEFDRLVRRRLSIAEIAAALGCHPNTVYLKKKARGLVGRWCAKRGPKAPATAPPERLARLSRLSRLRVNLPAAVADPREAPTYLRRADGAAFAPAPAALRLLYWRLKAARNRGHSPDEACRINGLSPGQFLAVEAMLARFEDLRRDPAPLPPGASGLAVARAGSADKALPERPTERADEARAARASARPQRGSARPSRRRLTAAPQDEGGPSREELNA